MYACPKGWAGTSSADDTQKAATSHVGIGMASQPPVAIHALRSGLPCTRATLEVNPLTAPTHSPPRRTDGEPYSPALPQNQAMSPFA